MFKNDKEKNFIEFNENTTTNNIMYIMEISKIFREHYKYETYIAKSMQSFKYRDIKKCIFNEKIIIDKVYFK